MSVRSSESGYLAAQQLRHDIATVQAAQTKPTELTFEQLSEVEKSAAMTGVSPDQWRPISWINEGHYVELLKSNSLSGSLTQKIEAFKVVASQ